MSSSDSLKSLHTSNLFLEQMLKQEGKGEQLDQVREGKNKVVVVPGQYDHIELVLGALKVPFDIVNPADINKGSGLQTAQTVFVNCPGSGLDREGLNRLQDYVRSGGKLVTTDWCVEHIIQQIFPDTIKRQGSVVTGQHMVQIQPQGEMGKRLVRLNYEGATPKWWLENSSHPVEIINPNRVKSFIVSDEMVTKWEYGSPQISVGFTEGEGAVLHFVSHLYAQEREVRDAREAAGAEDFSEMTQTDMMPGMYADVNVGNLETDVSSMSAVWEIVTGASGSFSPGNAGRSFLVQFTASGYGAVNFDNPIKVEELSAVYDVGLNPIRIGRGSHNQINLGDLAVSRVHAAVAYDGNDCVIRDLSSTNGMYINDVRVREATLKRGSTIRIGPGTLKVEFLAKI